ncbi:MAG: nudK [Caulobacteraceae bacterium]|nr:nudK [Caulobacteraceae bacterium]
MKIIERQVVYQGYMKIERLKLRSAQGVESYREMETHGEAVAVLPYDPERRCTLLVRQFRVPVHERTGQPWLEEACAGMIEPGHTLEDTVHREAMEELGLRLGVLEPIGVVWPSPGVSTERAHLFLAPYGEVHHVAPGGGVAEEHEEIEVVERPLAELAADAATGRIADAKLLILVLSLQSRRPELFG